MPYHQVVLNISVNILIVWGTDGKPSPGRTSPPRESDVTQRSTYHTNMCRHAFHTTYPPPPFYQYLNIQARLSRGSLGFSKFEETGKL